MEMGEKSEQVFLTRSAVTTFMLAVVGIAVGVMTGAKAIVFDGMYSFIDAAMTMGALFVARLIAGGSDRRFQYGYWHIEPMLSFLNGAILLFTCLYGFVDGVSALRMGGRTVDLGPGVAFALASALISLHFYWKLTRQTRDLDSMFLKQDANAWLFGGLLNTGIFVTFAITLALKGTSSEALAPYVDSVILIGLSAVMAPIPAKSLLEAGKQILQLAPKDLDAKVAAIVAAVAREHGYIDSKFYVSRVGRVQFIEIGLVAADPSTTVSYGALDNVRREIARRLGGPKPGYWLTVDFTADRRWI